MRVLRTPTDFRVEDRPDGLYLVDPLADAFAFVLETEGLAIRLSAFDDRYLVEIGYSGDLSDGVAEWGAGASVEDAWRYAFGAHFGSHDDPEDTQ